MVYGIIKKVGGKKYKYLVKSFRLPDGSAKKIWFTGDGKPSSYFLLREKELNFEYALRKFQLDSIFTEEQVEYVEAMRVEYRNIIRQLTQPQKKDLFDRFTANFTYESNALEGNSLTLKDVAMVLFEGGSVAGKSLREIYETRNSRRVVELMLAGKFSISHKGIMRMHRILMRDIDTPTGYKKLPNFLLGRRLETTPPEKVFGEMSALLGWYNANAGSIHPIKLAALFHGKFERIHPFEDGNGRVGRFLANAILLNGKYPPLIIRKSARRAYLSALEAFDADHPEKLEWFFLRRFRDTFRKFFGIYLKYLR